MTTLCICESPAQFWTYPRAAWRSIALGDTTTLQGGCIACDQIHDYTLKAVKITEREVVFEVQDAEIVVQ